MYEPHLYPFICWRTVRLFPCLSYCKQCFNEHLSACIFSISLKSPEDNFFNTNAYSHLRQNKSGSPRNVAWHLQFLNPPGDSCIDLLATWIFFFYFFKMYNCFTEFWGFLSNINKNQPQGHPCLLPPKPSSTSLPTPPFSLSQSPCLSSLSHTVNSCWLSILHRLL